MNSIATAISNGRTDTSFVDDLNALRGTVNSRVALLLRSIEVHPLQLRCVVLSNTPLPISILLAQPHTRVFLPWRNLVKITRFSHAQTVSRSARARATWNCGWLCSMRRRTFDATPSGVLSTDDDRTAVFRGTVGRVGDLHLAIPAHAGVFSVA
jgi:hypothetical protein